MIDIYKNEKFKVFKKLSEKIDIVGIYIFIFNLCKLFL